MWHAASIRAADLLDPDSHCFIIKPQPTTILALPGASLHYVGMKQPKKKPAVPGCTNWTSLELRYYYYYHQRKKVLENEYSAPHQTTVHSDTWRSSAIGCLKPT